MCIFLCFVFSALAVLTKGPLGFLIPCVSVMAFLLLQRDIKGFNPNAAPPSTNGKVRLIENSRSDIELYLQDALERFRPPLSNDLLVMADVIEFLRAQKVRCSDAEVRGFIRKKAVSFRCNSYTLARNNNVLIETSILGKTVTVRRVA